MEPTALLDLPAYLYCPDASRRSSMNSQGVGGHDCLTVPPPTLRDAILSAFAEFVFPQLPIVNMQQLIDAVDANGHGDCAPIGIFLFQAIMFAGVAYIPLSTLREYGLDSHHIARRAFFERAEGAYDITTAGGGCDPMALIQGLLLMTLWYDPNDIHKDSHHWMRILLTISRDIGLHKSDSPYTPGDLAAYRVWKRVAWFTLVRDRTILLGARRPALIRTAEFTVPSLMVSDFELEPLESRNTSSLHADCRLFRDAAQLQEMATLCVEYTHLILFVDEVFEVHERLKNKQSPAQLAQSLIACDAHLKACRLKHQGGTSTFTSSQLYDHHRLDAGIAIHRVVARLKYYTIVSALHRPVVLEGFNNGSDTTLQSRLVQTSQAVLEDATQQITELARLLAYPDLALLLPASSVTALLSALIVHILSTRSNSEAVRKNGLLGFEHCLRLLTLLRSRHANADDVYRFLEQHINAAHSDAGSTSLEMQPLVRLFQRLQCEKRPSHENADPELLAPAIHGISTSTPDDSFEWYTGDHVITELGATPSILMDLPDYLEDFNAMVHPEVEDGWL